MMKVLITIIKEPILFNWNFARKLFELISKKCDAISCVVIIQNGGRIVLLVDRIVFLNFFVFWCIIKEKIYLFRLLVLCRGVRLCVIVNYLTLPYCRFLQIDMNLSRNDLNSRIG